LNSVDKPDKWLSLLANTGVLVGITFLAIEIQQNTDNLKMNRQIVLAL